MKILIVLNTVIFLIISGLHWYWAVTGKSDPNSALPTKKDGTYLFKPGFFSTIVVAIGLLIFAAITMGNLGIYANFINEKYIYYSTTIIAFIFIARAVGEFKYVGFFKKIKNTSFADNDTRFYTPISFFIGIISLLIVLFHV